MKRMHLSQLMTVSLFPQEEVRKMAGRCGMMKFAGLCWEREVCFKRQDSQPGALALLIASSFSRVSNWDSKMPA
jgi:hypothetical protein